jgi:hypothetical protein
VSRDDWFRHHTWTRSDRHEFFARLERSRSDFHKAQYARIQAFELHQGGGKQYAEAALELLDLILERWKEAAQLAPVHHQRAECLRDMRDDVAALAAYRAAFDAQRRRPGDLTNAHLDFAWWVAVSPMPELFGEALAVLEEFMLPGGIAFPAAIYRAEGARALIRDAQGSHEQAEVHARHALEVAALRHSGLSHHPTVGLVIVIDATIYEKLKRVAAG